MKHIKSFETFGTNEAKGAASKQLQKAIAVFHDEQLKLQNLQKAFIGAKGNDTKRESLKNKLIAQNKIAKQAEKEFNLLLQSEEPDDTEIF